MIDFRYHLVSIVAVFLALAIGIVLGTTALNGPITSRLRSLETSLRSEADSLRTQKGELQQQVNSDQAFAQLAAPLVVAHLLDGQSVALVTAPGAQQQVISGVTAAVQLAGGTVTGQVALQQQFFDTSATNENKLIALAQQLALPQSAGTVQGAQQSASPQLTGQLQAASLLAAAIVTKDGPGLLASQSHAILDGFAQDGFLQVSKPAMTPATLAVVIIPATPPSAGDSDPANVALISMTQILNGACKGAVLAGSYPGSGAGSAIDELASGNTGIEVSSVDNANTATGQIFVVQALSKLLSGHKPASYGIATGSAPSPAPTPSASLSSVPSRTRPVSRHRGTGRRGRSATPRPSATASQGASR
jgi:hypothetical protein